jgi:hypothetical protein
MNTPGHTPGSTCFVIGDEEGEAVLTGDTLFIGSCGRIDNGTGSLEAMFNSLQRLKQLPNSTVVFPAHNYDEKQRRYVVMGDEKETNLLLRLETVQQLEQVIGPQDNSKLSPNKVSSGLPLAPYYDRSSTCPCACCINISAAAVLQLPLPSTPAPASEPPAIRMGGLPATTQFHAFHAALAAHATSCL